MARLIVLVEGQTEESFVNEVLAPYLSGVSFDSVSARIFGNARLRSKRGGVKKWESARKDIETLLKEDPGLFVTIMVDFYGMKVDWPGRQNALSENTTFLRAQTVEQAVLNSIANSFQNLDTSRFIPSVVMHEFEGLLFSHPSRFAGSIGHPELSKEFSAIAGDFSSPEEINDSYQTCPSRRVCLLAPDYDKVLHGVQAAQEIGLDTIRQKCLVFNQWIERLEAKAPPGATATGTDSSAG